MCRCKSCGAEFPVSPFCPSCQAVSELPPDTDYFTVLGLERRLALVREDLDRSFFALSRRVHPDRFGSASPTDQAASLANTALLNKAYQTLRDPIRRGRYWLELHGEPLANADRTVPHEIAALVFEVREHLDDAGNAGGASQL